MLRARGAESCDWDWKPGIPVHYAKKTPCSSKDGKTTNVAVVLLHGFGVASFHFEAQLEALSSMGFAVYAMDNVGAGLSWPSEDAAPKRSTQEFWWGLGEEVRPQYKDMVIGEGMWVEQVKGFIAECVNERDVFLCGNSLGGYLAVLAAADLAESITAEDASNSTSSKVRGLVLMNATPFWGFTPNAEQDPVLHKLAPWDGSLPVPGYVQGLALTWYNALRDPTIVGGLLGLVTAEPKTVGELLPQQIVTMASHPAGAAAFAQILFSPKSPRTFGEALRVCAGEKLHILLLYGGDDPWVVPFWGQCAKLDAPDADYWQITPCGHCPHHETPKAVNEALIRWLVQEDRGDGNNVLNRDRATAKGVGISERLPEGAEFKVTEEDGRVVSITVKGPPQPLRDGIVAWDEVFAWSWAQATR